MLPNDSLPNIVKPKIDTTKLQKVDSAELVAPKPKVEKAKDSITSKIITKVAEKDTTIINTVSVKPKQIKVHAQNTVIPESIELVVEKADTVKMMTTKELFGYNSKLLIPKYTTEQPPRVSIDRPFVTNTEIAIILLSIICFYAFLVYRFIHPIRLVVKNIFTTKGTMSYMETPSQDFIRFLSYGQQLSLLAITLTTTTIASIFIDKIQSKELFMFLAVWVALQITTIIQIVITKWCTAVSTNTETFSGLQKLRKFNITAFTLIYSPLAILATFSQIMTTVALLAMGLLAFWHIFRVLSYLRFKKFSFLQWFLYLCTVELLPLMAVTAILSSLIRRF